MADVVYVIRLIHVLAGIGRFGAGLTGNGLRLPVLARASAGRGSAC